MISEKCGLLAFYGKNTNKILIKNFITRLEKLQHRGRDSVGICYLDDNKEYQTFYEKGTVHDIFFGNPSDEIKKILRIKTKLILGHLRYATSNTDDKNLIQPLTNKHERISIAHNGNIPNAMLKYIIKKIKKEYFNFEINMNYLHDTNVFFEYIRQYNKTKNRFEKHLVESYKYFNGSYNFIVLYNENLYILRDQNAYRPLCYGKDINNNILISSESISFLEDYKYIDDLPYNETLTICDQEFMSLHTNEIIKSNKLQTNQKYKNSNCVFEYIYFMNNNSIIKSNENQHLQISVNDYRIDCGKELALQEKKNNYFDNIKKEDIIVVGSPNTAIPGAQSYAQSLSYSYQQVLKKRLNTGRTFIISNNDERDKYFKKFILDKDAIKDKVIIFVDDSIVRGNTIKSICHLFKINGAKEIHIRVLSPPVKNPCYYGIHIPTRIELLINRKNEDEIVKDFNLDSIMYLDLKSLDTIFGKDICKACFDNDYNPDILF